MRAKRDEGKDPRAYARGRGDVSPGNSGFPTTKKLYYMHELELVLNRRLTVRKYDLAKNISSRSCCYENGGRPDNEKKAAPTPQNFR